LTASGRLGRFWISESASGSLHPRLLGNDFHFEFRKAASAGLFGQEAGQRIPFCIVCSRTQVKDEVWCLFVAQVNGMNHTG
jgi:hypothetical protein